jgi:xylulokinase
VVGQAEQPGVLGAAVAAWTGLGRYGSFASAQDALVRVAQRYEPQAERAHAYRRMYRQFRAAEAALAPVSRALAGIDMG